jgi:hypothetical protein
MLDSGGSSAFRISPPQLTNRQCDEMSISGEYWAATGAGSHHGGHDDVFRAKVGGNWICSCDIAGEAQQRTRDHLRNGGIGQYSMGSAGRGVRIHGYGTATDPSSEVTARSMSLSGCEIHESAALGVASAHETEAFSALSTT